MDARFRRFGDVLLNMEHVGAIDINPPPDEGDFSDDGESAVSIHFRNGDFYVFRGEDTVDAIRRYVREYPDDFGTLAIARAVPVSATGDAETAEG